VGCAVAVLNLADLGHNPDNEDAAAALVDFPALALMGTPIRRRAHGLLVDEASAIALRLSSEESRFLAAQTKN
jgi:hypothetical protein